MFQSPINAIAASGSLSSRVAEPVQPVDLVEHVRVVDVAAVRDVDRPDAHVADGGTQRSRLALDRLSPAGHVLEADLDVVQAHP